MNGIGIGTTGGPVIAFLSVRPIRVFLSRPWGAGVATISVIETVVTDSDGAEGRGFSWTPTIGAESVRALLENDIASFAVGLPVDPAIWRSVWEHLHEAGGGGITTISLAGLDLALWDLRCRREGAALADVLGRRHDSQPAYGSGVNLHYSADELRAQVERWVATGFDAVKVKVGRPDLAEDVDRIRMVREVLGPDRALMIDANQRWDLDRATAAADALRPSGIAWLEEPLRADDTAGHAELRRRTDVPIALGENAHTVHRFRDLIDSGACDIVQPNVVRVGGITPFLEIAELARSRGIRLAPHLLPELSAQLAFALPEQTLVEVVEDAGFYELGALAEPTGVAFDGGRAHGGRRPGLGIRFS